MIEILNVNEKFKKVVLSIKLDELQVAKSQASFSCSYRLARLFLENAVVSMWTPCILLSKCEQYV